MAGALPLSLSFPDPYPQIACFEFDIKRPYLEAWISAARGGQDA
jgi:hypothetical protein